MEFDAYHKWLGIPPAEQPPHHYRLLGVQTFESDPDVIEAAADRQMMHLRTHQTGQHSDDSQRLLSEVSVARSWLLTPAKKAEYDAMLQDVLQPQEAPAAHVDLAVTPPPAANLDSLYSLSHAESPYRHDHVKSRRTKKQLPLVPIVIGGVVAVCAVLLLFGLLVMTALQSPDVVVQPTSSTGKVILEMNDEERLSATWSCDGQQVTFANDSGPHTIELATGTHQLVATRDGFEPFTTDVVVSSDQQIVVNAEWKKLLTPSVTEVADTSTTNAPASTIDPALLPTEPTASPAPSHDAIELLENVDFDKHTILGLFRKDGDSLITPSGSESLLVLPYQLPEEYTLTANVERLEDNDSISFYLRKQGRSFQVVFDGWDMKFSGIQRVWGNRVDQQKSRHRGKIFEVGNTLPVRIEVTRSHIDVEVDGRPIHSFRFKDAKLSPSKPSVAHINSPIISGYYTRWRVSDVQLTPISGASESSDFDLTQPVVFNGHCYQRVGARLTWREAMVRCRKLGGELVCIESKEEREFIRENLQYGHWIWMGGHSRGLDRQWSWLSRERFAYAPWATKRPNSRSQTQHTLMLGQKGSFRSMHPTSRLPFVCEWDAPSPTSPSKALDQIVYPFDRVAESPTVTAPAKFNGHTYALIKTPQMWHDAKLTCMQMGGRLCSVETKAEHEFLVQHLTESEHYWLGGTDEDVEGTYEWLSGAPFTFNAWGPEQPNNINYGSEHYLEYNSKLRQWNDAPGGFEYPFICEWETTTPAYFSKN